MPSWFAIYETATGRLRSLATIKTDPLGTGLAFIEFADRPDDFTNMWDEGRLSFIPRPAKILVDRWDDTINDPATKGIWIAMNAVNRGKLKTSITEILGTERFRNEGENPIIGADIA